MVNFDYLATICNARLELVCVLNTRGHRHRDRSPRRLPRVSTTLAIRLSGHRGEVSAIVSSFIHVGCQFLQ